VKSSLILPLLIPILSAQIELKVIATDHLGRPVPDLQAGELRLTDDGAPGSITSLQLNSSQASSASLVVMLDLMNLTFQERGQIANQLRAVATAVSFRLYLVVADGRLYPVSDVRVQLDQALQKANQLKPLDIRADPIERFNITYSSLDSMSQELMRIPGNKNLLWITDGIPSRMQSTTGWMEFAPQLHQLAAQINRSGTTAYSLTPSFAPNSLNIEGLSVLSVATGGQTFGSVDLNTALKRLAMDAAAAYSLVYVAPESRKAAGSLHLVRLSSARKGIRIRYQGAYLSESAPTKSGELPNISAAPTASLQILSSEPVYSFVGVVHSSEGRSLVLELDDARFIVIDFDKSAPVSVKTGDRVNVRSNQYDGHGLVVKTWSLMAPAAGTPTTFQPTSGAASVNDPFLQMARETSDRLTRSLPDFLCKEEVKRDERGVQDKLTADVSYRMKTGEQYGAIQVNGRATDKSWVSLGGDVSTGEFGSTLRSIFCEPRFGFSIHQGRPGCRRRYRPVRFSREPRPVGLEDRLRLSIRRYRVQRPHLDRPVNETRAPD
jgi:VWFA-related protein